MYIYIFPYQMKSDATAYFFVPFISYLIETVKDIRKV